MTKRKRSELYVRFVHDLFKWLATLMARWFCGWLTRKAEISLIHIASIFPLFVGRKTDSFAYVYPGNLLHSDAGSKWEIP
jgi:hypothetical protein